MTSMSIAIRKTNHVISRHPKQRSNCYICASQHFSLPPTNHIWSASATIFIHCSTSHHLIGIDQDPIAISAAAIQQRVRVRHIQKPVSSTSHHWIGHEHHPIGIFLANPTVELGAAHRLPITIESQSFNLHRPRSHRAFRCGGPIVDSAGARNKYPLPATSHHAIPFPSGHL